MSNKSLTLSIVIPVYNEERHLKACLDSIKKQTKKPDEVVIVDNNSADNSVKIAKGYAFAKLLKESRQSQVYAQKTGFDAAKGDIIGRIDGDTILPRHWAETVLTHFSDYPDSVGITGSAMPYDVYFKRTGKFIQFTYQTLAGLIAGRKMLWGANCALRKSAWEKVSRRALQRPDIWEDFDISFLLSRYGKLRYLRGIDVTLSFRAVHKSFAKQFEYQFRAIRTFAHHSSPPRTFLLGLLWSTQIILIYPLTVFDQYIVKSLFDEKLPTKRR